MKKILFFILAGVFFLFADNTHAQQSIDPSSIDVVKGKIRIKLNREDLQQVNTIASVNKSGNVTLGIKPIDNLNSELGITRMKRVFPFSVKFEKKHRKYGLHLWYELEFDEGLDPKSIADMYSVLDEVDIAKPLYKKVLVDGYTDSTIVVEVDTALTKGKKVNFSNLKSALAGEDDEIDFDDPMLENQWHYENDGKVGTKGVDIDLFNAWTKTTGSKDIIVSVVDGGIDYDHEDLKDNMWVNEAEYNGEEGVDDDGNGYIDDIHGYNFVFDGALTDYVHGTHVAGTVSAVNNNGIGVCGVAGGDGTGNGVRLMSCQIYDNRGGQGNYAAAIVYGADMGAVISQNSWGYTQPGFYEPEVLDAIKYFINEAGMYEGSPMKGGIVFFAAGNTGNDEKHYPGAFDEVVGVAATGPTGYPAPYSTRGNWVDISAPGGDQAYFGMKGGVLSTLPDDKYGYLQGTSMACPHASGVAALAIAKFGGEKFRAEDLRKLILGSTTPFIFESEGKYGSGNLNAALTLVENEFIPPNPVTDLDAKEVSYNQVLLEWTVPKDSDDFQPSYFILAISKSEITPGNFNDKNKYVIQNHYEAGTKIHLRINGLIKEMDYWFALKSSDRFQNISDISNIIHVKTTKEPHFTESHRGVEFQIDVTQDPVRKVQMTFGNTGEGIVYWNSFTLNEKDWWLDTEEWEEERAKIKAEEASTVEALKAENELLAVHNLTEEELDGDIPEYMWRNDNTRYVDAYYYVYANPQFGIGSNNYHAGLIHATRFKATRGDFDLNHIQLGLYIKHKEEPIYIEIRRGSDVLEEAKVVCVQKYYVDTTNLVFPSIPIFDAQHIDKNESFWVVLYFSNKEYYPLLGHRSYYYYPNTFYASTNNGISFISQSKLLGRHAVPFVIAGSTGPDGTYTFIDPMSGELKAGETQPVELTVDARNLANGRHIATVGLNTSDPNKPGVSIEVKVAVKGQKGKISIDDKYFFDVHSFVDNDLDLEIMNTGLDSVGVSDIISAESGESVKDFDDTLWVRVNKKLNVPFVYHPDAEGLLHPQFTLKTSVGDILVSTEMSSNKAPEITAKLDTNYVELRYDQEAQIGMTIENTGNGSSLLNYKLDKYNIATQKNGSIPNKFGYKIRTSDDADDPVTGQLIDVSAYADTIIDEPSTWRYTMKLPQGFPLYDSYLSEIYFTTAGDLFAYDLGPIDTEERASEYSRASGFIFPMLLNLSMRTRRLEYYNFGDKQVYDITIKLARATSSGVDYYNDIRYQIHTYRNGTIEFYYINIDALQSIPNVDYAVGIQGNVYGDYNIFKNYGDSTKFVHNGMIIRFEPDKDISFVSVPADRSGSLAKGTPKNLKVDITPSLYKVGAGTYNLAIYVESNASVKCDTLPVTIKLTGTEEFSIADTLDFGKPHVGHDKIMYLKVENSGSKAGEISSISFGDPAFRTTLSTPHRVDYFSNDMIPVIINASSAAGINTEMTITFDNGHSETVRLLADPVSDPIYTLNIEQDIIRDVIGGKSVKVPFTITNSANGADLHCNFKNSAFVRALAPDILPGEGTNNDTTQLYGYNWKFSDSTRVFYKWKDIKKDGTPHDITYEHQLAYKLPFKFPFYGGMYDTIWISRNGYVTVIKPEKDDVDMEFKKGDGIKGIIAPFYADMIPSDKNSHVWTLEEDDRVYILWDGYRGFDVGTAGGAVIFHLELVNDGSIYFNYLDINKYTHVLNYGLESPDERETFEHVKTWILSWGQLDDSLSVAIAPPLRDDVATGKSQQFNLELTADHIYRPGTYKDTVVLYTNSYSEPEVVIPVTLNVAGKADVGVPDTLNWGDVIYSPDRMISNNFVITNTGHDVASVEKIIDSGLEDFELFDKNGKEIKRTSTGTLFDPIKIAPWDEFNISCVARVSEFADINGKVILKGNFDNDTIKAVAKVVESPVFDWNAEDQSYSVNNIDTTVYTFTVENKGKTPLKYELIPAVVPSGDGGQKPDSIVDEIGYYEFDQPQTVDSLAWDTKEKADGYESPMIEVTLAFANEFTAPEGGFYLTHVKVNGYFRKLKEYISIQVYKGGDKPMEGELVYRQEFVTHRYVDEEWVYFPLKYPLSFKEGEKFYIVIIPPFDMKYIGYDIASSESVAAKSWAANYRSWVEDSPWNWQQYNNMMRSYKIRALTAAGENLWLELDNLQGVLNEGESKQVNATIFPDLAGKGSHKAMVKAYTNDANRSIDDFDVNLNVNGAPVIKFRPNMYKDTLRVVETEKLAVNYLFYDPEGEKVTAQLLDSQNEYKPEFVQAGDSIAQLTFKPGYFDAGVYEYEVTLTDARGSVTRDKLVIEVVDKNRPPELNPNYSLIKLNIADPNGALLIPSDSLFSDPDGDMLQIYAGNYTPDIVDMALGNNYMDLHPLQVGTGFLVFAADDGKEDGFVVYGVYVIVYDDESAVSAEPDSFDEEAAENLVSKGEKFALYPNPVTGSVANVVYKLDEDANVVLDIYSIDGAKKKSINQGAQTSGIYTGNIIVGDLASGLYFCKLMSNGKVIDTIKFFKK